MPIYEYVCDGCAYQFEVKQSIKDAALTTCERCGKSLRRLISSPGIMFKGSGWYVTDYSNKLKAPSEGEKAPATAGDKKDAPAGSTTPSASPTNSPAAPASGAANNASSSTSSTTNSTDK